MKLENVPVSIEKVRLMDYDYKGFIIRVEKRGDSWYWFAIDINRGYPRGRNKVQDGGNLLTAMSNAERAVDYKEIKEEKQ